MIQVVTRKILLVLFCVFFFITARGQNISSQNNIDQLLNAGNKNRNVSLQELDALIAQMQNELPDSLGKNALHFDDNTKIAAYVKAATWLASRNADACIKLGKKIALYLSQASSQQKNLGITLRNIGDAYYLMGDYPQALRYYQSAAAIFNKLNNQEEAATSNISLGRFYMKQNECQMAKDYLVAARNVYIINKNDGGLAAANNFLGNYFEDCLSNLDSALYYYQQTLNIYQHQKQKDKIAISYSYDFVSGIMAKKGDYKSSLQLLQQALRLRKEVKDSLAIAVNINNIGEVYKMKGDDNIAEKYFLQALLIAPRVDKRLERHIYDMLSQISKKKKNYNNAYHYLLLEKTLQDSITSESRNQQIADMQVKYETRKKETEIAALQQQHKISALQIAKQNLLLQKRTYQIIAVSGLMILLIVIAYFLYNRQRQAQEKLALDAEYKERVRIAKDMHDDLGAGLSRISLMADLAQREKNGFDNSNSVTQIAQTSKELISNMHDLIWILNPENTTLDNLVAHIHEYCSEYAEGTGLDAIFDMPAEVPAIAISRAVQRNIFLTVKEAIHNCLKHSDAKKLSVNLQLINNQIEIIIADNGKGFDKSAIRKRGNGLRNMKHRMELIGGKFIIDTTLGKGTLISICININKLNDTAQNENTTFV